MNEQATTQVGAELVDLCTKDEFLARSQEFGNIEATDFEFGEGVAFRTHCDGVGDNQQMEVMVDGNDALMSSGAVRDAVRFAGVSQAYFNKTPLHLFESHLNYHYRDRMKGKKGRMLTRDDQVVSMSFDPRELYIGVEIAQQAFEQAIGANNIIGYHNPQVSWDRVVMNIVLNDTFAVRTGDPINIGIRVVISPNEITAPQAGAYTFRQWCKNGMTTEDLLPCFSKSRAKGGNDNFRKWVDSTVVNSREAIDREHHRLAKLDAVKTDEHTGDFLDSILRRREIAAAVREEVKNVAIEQPTETLYDVWNILTRVVTHSTVLEKHPASLPLLEQVTTHLADHGQLCPTCHRAN